LVAVERANAQERLLKAEIDYQRQLKRETTSAQDKFQHAVLERDRTIDQQLTQLHHLAAVNMDLCGELAEAKAQTTELRLEVARILHNQSAATQDLMRLAARLLQLSSRLGIPLDRPTADIYRRRGWPTTMPASAR
jgi:chromosome segregation ATPase